MDWENLSPGEPVSDYQPGGDQPEALAKLVQGVGEGGAYQPLGDVSGARKQPLQRKQGKYSSFPHCAWGTRKI